MKQDQAAEGEWEEVHFLYNISLSGDILGYAEEQQKMTMTMFLILQRTWHQAGKKMWEQKKKKKKKYLSTRH